MKKISILDQFAADAINAPAVVTGGGACKVTKVKTVKCKSSSKQTKVKCGTKSNKSGKSGGGCTPCPPKPCGW
jgi:hypothetical protein